jgi:hypothetical protein
MTAVNRLYQLPLEAIDANDAATRATQNLVEHINANDGLTRIPQKLVEFISDIIAQSRLAAFGLEFIWIPTGRLTQFNLELLWIQTPLRDPRLRPDFGHARRIRDVNRGAGHRWIDNPGRRA